MWSFSKTVQVLRLRHASFFWAAQWHWGSKNQLFYIFPPLFLWSSLLKGWCHQNSFFALHFPYLGWPVYSTSTCRPISKSRLVTILLQLVNCRELYMRNIYFTKSKVFYGFRHGIDFIRPFHVSITLSKNAVATRQGRHTWRLEENVWLLEWFSWLVVKCEKPKDQKGDSANIPLRV